MELIKASKAPLVLWLMDDWPARLRAAAPDEADALDADLKKLFARSSLNLAISEGMAEAFSQRYDVPFDVAHNGIIPDQWQSLTDSLPLSEAASTPQPVRLRYAGSLAPDTTRDSVLKVAKAISKLSQSGEAICFEGRTQSHWYRQFADMFNDLPGVDLQTSDMSEPDYRKWLSEADIALLAYNFDEETRRYLQFSFANKLPELLASGAAVLAHGPLQLETMSYLHRHEIGEIVSEPDEAALEASLLRLIRDPDLRRNIGRAGQAHAFEAFSLQRAKSKLSGQMAAMLPADGVAYGTVHKRKETLRLNECQMILDLLAERTQSGVMIDIGAHVGGSLAPFAETGWRVLAFEPDPVNRAKLLEATAPHKNVKVSDRAVGKSAAFGVNFYTSDVSSGISSLTAFHDSHKVSHTVDITTLDEVVRSEEITHIDFLKIDVEGHEMDVLDGFAFAHVKPEIIMLEFEDGKIADNAGTAEALSSRLMALGYHVYISEWHPVVQYGVAHDWRQFVEYPTKLMPGSWGNLIAFAAPPSASDLTDALRRNVSGGDFGLSAHGTLAALAPLPGLRQRGLTWLARRAPWLRPIWHRVRALARPSGPTGP